MGFSAEKEGKIRNYKYRENRSFSGFKKVGDPESDTSIF